MKKTLPSLTRQLEILGMQVLLGCCAQPALHAGQPYIPGYYGNASSILPPAANALPSGASVISGINGIETTGNAMTVHQDKPRAVIHWGSFDIGSDASVRFEQPDTSSKVLNRVTGNSPSQIYGNLTANGQVYILNQNGILFGQGSQINVHSLTASALNIKFDKDLSQYANIAEYDKQFATLSSFYDGGTETYQLDTRLSYTANAAVANHGSIATGNLGTAFLIGPQVENNGSITAEGGDVGLLAGDSVSIYQNSVSVDFNISATSNRSDTAGTATNYAAGTIVTDKGFTGMYGKVVNQEGVIRATTALEKNGRIKLVGTEKVRTGAASITEAPVSASDERKIVDASAFDKSEITITSSEGSFEHYGQIIAPGGNVTVSARDRIYLESGSSIDVSGSWVALTAGDRMVEVQLNSEELRDAFAYKDGPLKGKKIQVDIVTGLDLADISGYFQSMAKTAAELTTAGGSIYLRTTGENGEVVVKQGANLDFSGGGVIYGDGLIASSKVRIGKKLYDLQDIPAGVPIDEVLGSYSLKHERYGLTDTWKGLYYGGSSPYLSYLPSFVQGSDAGSLLLNGRKIVLDGTMNASVVRGIYQTLEEEDLDENGNLKTVGRRVPRAGTLQIGEAPSLDTSIQSDLRTDTIVVQADVAPTTVTAEGHLQDDTAPLRTSELSTAILNGAGLGALKLYANDSIIIDKSADLALAELGNAVLASRFIEQRGSIRIPSGTVDMTIRKTVGSNLDHPERIFLASGSVIDVSGLRLDNSTASSTGDIQFGFTHGGTVTLFDNNDAETGEILLADGSSINVNGGYIINGDHSLDGGDAGNIALKGSTVQPSGTLTGLALEGHEGGSLSIHANELTLTGSFSSTLPDGFSADDILPSSLQHRLSLASDRFADSGFAHLTFKSEGDLLVERGVDLTPSSVRLAEPVWTRYGYRLGGLDTALPEYFGPSSIALAAGQTIYTDRAGSVTIEEGANLTVAPAEGAITIDGDSVTLGGALTALGGDIRINALNGDVNLSSTARIDASGTYLPDWAHSLVRTGLHFSVVDGGAVSLTASNNLVLGVGSLVDVSGSEAITNKSIDQRGRIVETTTASAAGSIDLSFGGSFAGDGQLSGASTFDWLSGGSLTLAKATNTKLTVNEEQVAKWLDSGFDELTFSSRREIDFLESAKDNDNIVTIAAGRALTLNGSALIGTSNQDIRLSAPWVRLTNIVEDTDGDLKQQRTFGTIAQGTARLSLAGEFIDIQGNVALSGFDHAGLYASQDLRLYDYYYSTPQRGWSGALRTAGDLTLQAAAIYPATHHSASEIDNIHTVYPSSFTISAGLTDNQGKIAAGKGRTITILPSAGSTDHAISSAGGRLALQAGAIEQYGVLAAPMGTISLTAENGIHLYPGSTLRTRGDGMTLYGKLEDEQWTVGGYLDGDAATNGLATLIAVDAAPGKSITLSAKEITQADGSTIDVGGGGSIFAYQFLPGFDGSVNPLGKSNRSVILPDNSVILPGKTVYLEGTEGLPAGTYSLLPVEYAFLPGALVIETTGDAMLSGQTRTTALGYTVVAGYESDRSIAAASPLRTGYIVRSATDVLAEGNFATFLYTAGDAGSVVVNAGSGSSVLAGSILGDALAGYSGGSLTLGAEDLFVGRVALLSAAAIDDYNLVFDIDKLRNRGLRQLTLGGSTTKTITVGADSALQDVAQVNMDADERITLEQGAQIHAMANGSQPGTLSLDTNALYGGAGTVLHASDALTLSVNTFSADTFAGTFQVDHGSFRLNSQNIFLEPIAYAGTRETGGAYLSSAMLGTFNAIDTVVLNSIANITCLGDVNLTAKGDLTLDSARIAVTAAAPAAIDITAHGTLQLSNDSSASSQNAAASGSSLHLNAGNIVFDGSKEVFLDTFNDIRFASQNETIFKGTGTLKADLSAGGNLAFAASRYIAKVTQSTAANADGSESLTLSLSDFTVDAGAGKVVMAGNGPAGSGIMAMPGALTVKGGDIVLEDATFDLPGGEIAFQANGDISAVRSTLHAKGGSLHFPVAIGDTVYDNSFLLEGGQIVMESTNGRVAIDEASILDTSAASGLDGGAIFLTAAQGGVTLAGAVRGDELRMDTNAIADFSVLATTIGRGGFDRLVDLRTRTGNVTIGQNDAIATGQFVLTADQGAIDIAGTIDASGTNGGTVEISANNTLTLRSGSRIIASARDTGGEGGNVSLASATGGVVTETGSSIDVSGSTPDTGGSVSFRALRNVIEGGGMRLQGTIQGASEAIARAFRVYPNPVPTGNVVVSSIASYLANITSNWTALTTAWNTAGNSAAITLVPEIEVRSNGNMTIAGGLTNLASLSVPNGIPGVLTFRAAGNLDVTSNIVDAPQSSLVFNELTGDNVYAPLADHVRDSWDLNFIAGADMTSARLLAVRDGIGNFTIGAPASGNVVYTESGDIAFASGKDTTVYVATSMQNYMPGTNRYNLASFDGAIRGFVGNNLALNGGIIQTGVSDIALQVGGDVTLSYTRNGIRSYGAIRTIGRAPTVEEVAVYGSLFDDPDYSSFLQGSALERYWDYRDGGDIALTVAGDISGDIVKSANGTGWGYAYNDFLAAYALGQAQVQAYGADFGVGDSWGASTSNQAAHGIVTMAGGDIRIKGDDIKAQIGVFGDGDLDVYARGNLDGRFLATDGDIRLASLTNFGNTNDAIDTLVELGAGKLAIQALGNTSLGAVVNPTLTTLRESWLLTYSQDSSVTLLSALGDVILSGDYSFVNDDSNFRYHLLPGTLRVAAARDIRINSIDDMYLAPSAHTQFSLIAGRDINGKSTSASSNASYQNAAFYISAADPNSLYGAQTSGLSNSDIVKTLRYGNVVPEALHIDNQSPALVSAGRDIANLTVAIPKQAEITAQRDIRELNYWGQNLHKTDVSLISAGRNLIQQPYKGKNEDPLGIWQAGHGFLLVRAGDRIDLGSSSGIQSTGNVVGPDSTTDINTALFDESDKDEYGLYKGADIAVLSGYGLEASNTELADFFVALAQYGKQFSKLMSTGDEDDVNEAAGLKTIMLEEVINPLLAGKKSGSGDIKMTQSVIKTTSGQDALYILAAGKIDVGTTIAVDFDALKAAGKTDELKRLLSLGILTQGGGDINVFAEGNINVNESRVVTSFGGDIFMLSNHGDINAGRGSTTTISYPEEKTTQVGGKRVDKIVPPVPGSGIRTDTADADGSGPLGEPPQGEAALIAWEGVIDAGEAGIAASNVTLAATKILNSENISFSEAGVGVPTTADAGPSIGALAGSTTVTDTQTATQSIGQQMAESSKQLAETVNKMAESLNIKMMIFKFEGFGNE